MKNTTELRNELSKVFEKLKKKEITTDEARSFVSMTNSMIKSALSESEYNRFLGKRESISFLKTQNENS